MFNKSIFGVWTLPFKGGGWLEIIKMSGLSILIGFFFSCLWYVHKPCVVCSQTAMLIISITGTSHEAGGQINVAVYIFPSDLRPFCPFKEKILGNWKKKKLIFYKVSTGKRKLDLNLIDSQKLIHYPWNELAIKHLYRGRVKFEGGLWYQEVSNCILSSFLGPIYSPELTNISTFYTLPSLSWHSWYMESGTERKLNE